MRFTSKYVSFLERFNIPFLILTLILSGMGLYYSVFLYKDLRTDLEELLPENAQSVKDVKRVVSRVGGFNHLSIVIESSEPKAGFQFQQDLVAELKKLPPTLVARVEDNIIKERAFFEKNKHLYMDLEDWKNLDEYVDTRIKYEKNSYESKVKSAVEHSQLRRLLRNGKISPEEYEKRLALTNHSPEPKAPNFDFKALEEKYEKRAKELDRFPDGYFKSKDGFTHIILVFLPGKLTDQKANDHLHAAAVGIVKKLNPQRYSRDMVVGFNGDVSNMKEEHEGLIEDLELSTVVVLLLVGLVLILYYRTWGGVYALIAALFAGTLWTFGLSYYWIGYLNANTAFLGSIVIGNGINFGVILLARYLEERRRDLSPKDALIQAITYTTRATLVASLAAGTAYVSLVATDFRGFSQFGIIGGLGMVLCWISTFTVLPALLLFLERFHLINISKNQGGGRLTFHLAFFVSKNYKHILWTTLFSIVLSIGLCFKFNEKTLESDFSKLRNKKSMEQGSGFWSKKVDAVFQRYLTPTVIVTETPDDAKKVIARLKELQKREGAMSPISDVKITEDFLPTEQEEKIKHIRNLQSLLTPQIIARLKPREKRRVEEIIPSNDAKLKPVTLDDIPEGIKIHFRELNGTLGNLVHVYPILGTTAQWDGREVIRFAEILREAVRTSGVDVEETAIAGQAPLSSDMISIIARDGPKATLLAFLLVSTLVILIFRNFDFIKATLASLLLGVLWMLAYMAYKDLKINFLNFIALPITFGIGVDYSVNIVSRYYTDKKMGKANIFSAIGETGGAVALCSLTTMIGYGSLLIAGSQAFVSFGVLSVLGEVTCILVALIVLPAYWVWEENKGKPVSKAPSDLSREHKPKEFTL